MLDLDERLAMVRVREHAQRIVLKTELADSENWTGRELVETIRFDLDCILAELEKYGYHFGR